MELEPQSPGSSSLSLVPLPEPEPAPEAEVASPVPEAPIRLEVDAFLAKAASEYRQGRVDRALWDQTAKEFEGRDKQAIIAAYLRVRARELKKKHQEDTQHKAAAPKTSVRRTPGMLSQPRARYAIAGGAIGVVALIGTWMLFSGDEDTPAAVTTVAAKPAARVAPKPVAPPAAAASAEAAGRSDAGVELEAKVRSLEQSGNWNVLVLYASEWTRKEPQSAPAWTALSNGYLRMRQWDDALDAAKRVVTVAPESAASWRNLGHVEVALERWPEARAAFEKSLALKGDDLDALCGAAQVANAQGRPKDAAEFASRVAQAGTGCPHAGNAVRSAAVDTQRKPASPAR